MNIFVFAEERSGSTWTTNQICRQSMREHGYVELNNEEIPNDTWAQIVADNPIKYSDQTKVWQTHRFEILKSIPKLLGRTLLIRCTRRNVLEQVLSHFFWQRTKESYPDFWNTPHYWNAEVMSNNTGITISEDEIKRYLLNKAQRDALWSDYAPDGQTIYYEDLFDGVEIPAMRMTLSFNSPSEYHKLTYAKQDYFSNVEQIAGWLGSGE